MLRIILQVGARGEDGGEILLHALFLIIYVSVFTTTAKNVDCVTRSRYREKSVCAVYSFYDCLL